ncbi:MAG: hypothetical protein M3O78_02850 [Chloroflexota bacterium]|nr:hypothetical protein [Chloroflexota bacterium]
MNFSKLSSNEKLAVYGAILVIVGALLGFGGVGGGGFGLLPGLAMLVIIFLPQLSPTTQLPGSKGSLMLIVGGLSALGALFSLLGLLTVLGLFAFYGGFLFVGLLLGIVGGLMMGWASWQEFQSEGGKFVLGMPASTSTPAAPPAAPVAPPAAPAPPAPPEPPAPMDEPMAQPMDEEMHEPMAGEMGSGMGEKMNEPMGGSEAPHEHTEDEA